MKQFTRLSATTLAIVTAAALSACSSGPSESDAKVAVQASLGGCEYLSIDHFEKVNGTPQGDGHYLVDVKYTVSMKPTPDIKAYASEKYAKEIDNLKTQLAHAHEVENAWKADEQAWIQANPGQNSSAYEVAHQDGWAEYQKVMPLLLSGDQFVNNAPRTAKAAMERAMRQSCPNVNSSILDNFFNGNEPVEQYADGIEETFTGKVAMTRTDNGWQEDR
ncbi:hypothetical protein BOC40_01540 [Burkholderia pseudomallei]|uniref:hypothetical protein n=1 Tax=Burkholderia pseudomallei TaxID=28450 RepID=UPI000A1A25B0|nr:hypothetical protein [Burkholderia pseudomallei]ARK79256.1 hypothetical protein BOC40_01540 [Burkholderia pseudomallei]ARL47168.1 hypothetical protein BOC50_30390 [Burkholderia pseudomallei]